MKLAFNRTRQFFGVIASSIQRGRNTLWDVYTKPTPHGVKEVLLLVSLCFVIGGGIFGLLYAWMNLSLQFESHPSFIMAGFFSSLLFLVILLVHPVRCMFSILLPSLGTNQGRKILLSTAIIMVAASCIPNMAKNITVSVHMLQCASKETAESILNTHYTASKALSDMNQILKQVPDIVQKDSSFVLKQDVDISEMKRELDDFSTKIKTNFKYWQNVLDILAKLSKKLIALAFVVFLIGGSVHYLTMYLTDLRYDNIYATHSLMELLKAKGEEDLPLHYKKKLVKTAGWKMTGHEVKRGIMGLMIFIIYVLLSVVIMGLDYFIFSSLKTLTDWAKEIPEIHASFTYDLTIRADGPFHEVINFFGASKVKSFTNTYSYTIPLLPAKCMGELSTPDDSILASVVTLYVTALVMLLGEVYATRLRRKFCASFYRSREDERIHSLLQRLLGKRGVP